MKKKGIAMLLAVTMAAALTAGCGKNTSDQGSSGSNAKDNTSGGPVNLISREEGSGTRGAFIELFGIEEKDASGEKVDMTYEEAQITNNTSVMMTTVAGDTSTIGYISLGSLNDTVKALKIDGAEATAEDVKNGSYKISRKFNIITKEDMSLEAKEFIDFILSSDGQAIVEAEGYIPLEGASSYEGSNPKGKVVIAGSSSVTPVMEKLAEAYKEANTNAEIEVQQSDSTTGITSARDGLCDIGMASRELKESETSYGLTATVIATDGIAVIVNKSNPIDELSSDQVKEIYTGELTEWSELTK